jgi:hypothetical protein
MSVVMVVVVVVVVVLVEDEISRRLCSRGCLVKPARLLYTSRRRLRRIKEDFRLFEVWCFLVDYRLLVKMVW